MVKQGYLVKKECEDSKRNLPPTNYLQTEKGRMIYNKRFVLKAHRDIIGIREKAYQLLFQYSAFGDIPTLPTDYGRNILEDEQQLQKFLSEFHISPEDLEIERVDYNHDKSRVIKLTNHNQKIRIHKVEYLNGSKKLEGSYHYYLYMLPGISIREFLHGIKGGRALEHIPQSMTLSEVEECFELLSHEELIKIVMNFHGELRFDITNESLKEVIKECWVMHGIATMIMKLIWEFARLPTKDEYEWYEMLWGKQRATVHLNQRYEKLRTRKKDRYKKGYHKIPENIELCIRNWDYKGISEKFEEINKKYDGVIKKFSILLDMLMKMCYPEFLRKLVETNEI